MPSISFEPTYFGRIRKSGSATWATVRDAATGDTVTIPSVQPTTVGLNSGNFLIDRGVMIFNTSIGIPVGATILSGKVRLYPDLVDVGDNDGNDYFNIYTFAPADPDNVAVEDFDQFGTTAKSSPIDLNSFTINQYHDFVLNDLTLINPSSYTILGSREGHDVLNNQYAGSNGTFNQVQFQVVGEDNPPLLVVEYSLPSSNLFYSQI